MMADKANFAVPSVNNGPIFFADIERPDGAFYYNNVPCTTRIKNMNASVAPVWRILDLGRVCCTECRKYWPVHFKNILEDWYATIPAFLAVCRRWVVIWSSRRPVARTYFGGPCPGRDGRPERPRPLRLHQPRQRWVGPPIALGVLPSLFAAPCRWHPQSICRKIFDLAVGCSRGPSPS